MCRRNLSLRSQTSKLVLILSVVNLPSAAGSENCTTAKLKFSPGSATSISPFVPDRLMSPGWSNVYSAGQCVLKTLFFFPMSRGFLYNNISGLCTPLLWLKGSRAENAKAMTPEEGTLYLVKEICRDDFNLQEYGSEGRLMCLQDSTSYGTYLEATSACNASQSHLIAVKTAEILEVVRAIAAGIERWVGMDDLDRNGTYVWQSDGTTLTDEEKLAVFGPGEPNSENANVHCVYYYRETQKLHDKTCMHKHRFICEISLPIFDV
ncbi:C-type lectin-related protein 4 [Elysia marginata]|uniref:C-type lectin-related protein 4 n=1 Tax=Elysia marginata TaxID=1093978 RepID=A0AAV4FH53_9GAST|nr:C-type lectin-related protein 4 [Elysia marginata]